MAPKTPGKNDDHDGQNDRNGGADKDFEGKTLAVAGSTSNELKVVRLFTSAPIVKRFDVFTLETADGICVCIKGFINKQRTTENGFSSEVFNHFTFGFPPYWEECAKKYFEEDVSAEVEVELVPNSSKSATNTDPNFISTRSKHEKVVSQDEHVQMSCVENASKGSDVLNHAVKSSEVEERSKLGSAADMDCSHDVAEQTNAAVDDGSTEKDAANLPGSIQRVNHSPPNMETNKVKGRRNKNEANVSQYIVGTRTTRSNVRMTKCSQKENFKDGFSTTHKDRASRMEQKLNRKKPHNERLKVDNAVDMDSSHNVAEQANAAADDGGTHKSAANCPGSFQRVNHSPPNTETNKENGRRNKNEVNVSPYDLRTRTTRNHVQITECSQKKNIKAGFSTTHKDRVSRMELQDEQSLNRSKPQNERWSPGKDTRRNLELDFDKVANPSSKGRNVMSPQSMSLKCSRSGRILLPPLEFWRNQIPVYDKNRSFTAIMEEADAIKQSGSRSEPQKRRKLV
ncbi:SANT associated [Corchorus olitorius]|uniref:SANT associated n=1 Tax=Corchorus olitorius TaxID=93759 RepID=A0A1R3JR63_9ROSI|nr:SANT associated [Corchorus olitorius]